MRLTEHFQKLKEALSRSWLKKEATNFNSASAAITPGSAYYSGILESKTHLLDITSESAALSLAMSHADPMVSEVITLVRGEFIPNPLVVKILADHARRTGLKIHYSVYDESMKLLFELKDASSTYYSPKTDRLERISGWKPRHNSVMLDLNRPVDEQLRECAKKGMETHFTSNTGSLYGSAVLAGNRIYFGGVYSSYEKRLNLHAEMAACIGAFADGNTAISKVAIISTKFNDSLPSVCGCCRQFLIEIQQKTGMPITLVMFTLDGSAQREVTLDDALPDAWSS